jgi:hypothetical protein
MRTRRGGPACGGGARRTAGQGRSDPGECAQSALLLGRWDEATGLLDRRGWETDAVIEERASLRGEFAVRHAQSWANFATLSACLRSCPVSLLLEL